MVKNHALAMPWLFPNTPVYGMPPKPTVYPEDSYHSVLLATQSEWKINVCTTQTYRGTIAGNELAVLHLAFLGQLELTRDGIMSTWICG